jgi:hypothetical protein
VNPESEEFFWRHFDINDTEEYGDGWRMPIPQSQKLTLEAKSSLISLVGEEKDFNDQIDWYWKLNNLLGKDLNPLICVISRNEIEAQNFSGPTKFFDRVLINSAVARKCQSSVEFCIYGYESDPRELYEILEVRHYLQALEPMVKYWFFFLKHHPSSHSLKLLMSCVCGITAVCDQVQYKNSYLNRVKKQSTMIKPIESIFISNSINRHSNCLIKSIKTTSFCRT